MMLALESYRVTASFPQSKLYGLTSQIRRSAVSIAANIAEGHGREQAGAFIQFLRIVQGSLKELETHVILATQLEFMDDVKSQALLDTAEEIGKMVRSLIRRLQEKAG